MIPRSALCACLFFCAPTYRAACLPDPAYSPTPTLEWTHDAVNTEGYTAWWRPDYRWAWHVSRSIKLPCQRIAPEDGAPSFLICRGIEGGLPYPIQRAVSTQLETLDWAITAYNAAGESGWSNFVTICMPGTWVLR